MALPAIPNKTVVPNNVPADVAVTLHGDEGAQWANNLRTLDPGSMAFTGYAAKMTERAQELSTDNHVLGRAFATRVVADLVSATDSLPRDKRVDYLSGLPRSLLDTAATAFEDMDLSKMGSSEDVARGLLEHLADGWQAPSLGDASADTFER